jgi:hypothetical protein
VAEDQKPPLGFVPLKSLSQGAPDPAAALAEIRQIYFKTTKQTIEHDFAHAIELLKSLPEEHRDRAAVYMQGLAEMQREFLKGKGSKKNKGPAKGTRAPRQGAPGGRDRRKPDR